MVASREWVTCVLDSKGRHRQVMTPGRYTHLLFLDEATALAAGHRPVGSAVEMTTFASRTPGPLYQGLDAGTMKTEAMNRVLHPERVAGRWKHRYKPTFTTTGGLIPDRVMFHQGKAIRWRC